MTPRTIVRRAGAVALLALAGLAATSDPATSDGPDSLRVVVISDLNGRYGSTTYGDDVHAAVERIRSIGPDLVISTGDLVAGQRQGLDYRAMWRSFDRDVWSPLSADGIPLLISPGNHDASGFPRYAGERAIFVDEWRRRRADVYYLDDRDYPLRYSFAMGQVLFLSLDATRVGPLGAEELAWVRRQLEAGARYPVKVVFGHVPLYPFSEGRASEYLGDPELERLLSEHRVDLFLSGHHHSYYPGRRGELRLVSVGCLGSGPRALLGGEEAEPRSFVSFRVEDGRIVELEGYGGDAFTDRIRRSSLPERVGAGSTAIMRDDVGSRTRALALTGER